MPLADKTLKLFVSYARADTAFADELVSGLEWIGYKVSIDRASILEGEDWRKRLRALIAEADTVIFLLSPPSVRSPEVAWEVEEAVRLSKRIVPVLVAPTGGLAVPGPLAQLNYVRFDPQDDGRPRSFVGALRGLQRALETDLDWLREHTRLLERATEWQVADEPAVRLLRGGDIEEARRWAAARPQSAPAVTDLQLAFIQASEEAERLRTDNERRQLEAIASAQVERSRALDDREVAVRVAAHRTRLGIAGTTLFGLVGAATGWWALRAESQSLRDRAQAAAAGSALTAKQSELARLRELLRSEAGWQGSDSATAPPEIVRPPARPAATGPVEPTWAVRRTGAERQPYTGAGVTVAIIDSGIDAKHPAFAGVEIVQKDFSGEGHGDQLGHGTMLSSLVGGRDVAGRRIGIAPGVSRIVAVKFIGRTGMARMEALPLVLDWVLSFEGGSVDVVCLGFGLQTVTTIVEEVKANRGRTGVSRALETFAQVYRTTEGILTAAAAAGKGTLVFSPAGNDNGPGEEVRVNSPTAIARGVISVAAAEERPEGLVVTDYSDVGATLAAPGSKVQGAARGGLLTEMSGTSISCAVAAGTAALWWEMQRKQPGADKVGSERVWAAMKAASRTDAFAPAVKPLERGLGLVQAPPAA